METDVHQNPTLIALEGLEEDCSSKMRMVPLHIGLSGVGIQILVEVLRGSDEKVYVELEAAYFVDTDQAGSDLLSSQEDLISRVESILVSLRWVEMEVLVVRRCTDMKRLTEMYMDSILMKRPLFDGD
jgi:hypothetical protein